MFDDVAEFGIGGVDRYGRAFHRNLLRSGADLEFGIDGEVLSDREVQFAELRGAESIFFDREFVGAGRKLGDGVGAAGSGEHFAGGVGCGVVRGYLGMLDERTRGIGNRSVDGSGLSDGIGGKR